jgi:hypothetical protein
MYEGLFRRPAKKLVEAVGRGMKSSEAAHLFRASLSSIKHYARGWSLLSSTQGKDDRRVDMTKVVLRYRTNLAVSVETYPRCIRANGVPKLFKKL